MDRPDVYDAILIGSGQAANPLATALASAGLRTALIERAFVGGTCINYGCTPTKTMVASARVAHLVRRAEEYGIGTGQMTVDMGRIRERKRSVVESFRSGIRKRLESADGLELIGGSARFLGPKTLEVRVSGGGTRQLSAERIVIDTGTSPSRPPIEGLDRVPVLDSTSVMELDRVPARLLVIGGGYVGVEFAQIFRRFGAEVILVQRGGQLLGREDDDVAGAVADILREDGIDVLLGTEASRLEPDDDGAVRVTLRTSSGTQTHSATHILLAPGRVPNTAALDLERAGIATDDRGFIRVSEHLETSAPGVYAAGDVKGGPAFTHISYDDFRVLRANLLDDGGATIAGRLVPYTVFTDPQLGRIGMTEREARAAGRTIRLAKMPVSHVARALETGETRGLMKAVIDADTDRILGCAILAADGGEAAAVVQIAMMGGLTAGDLRAAVLAHPTFAESLNTLFGSIQEGA